MPPKEPTVIRTEKASNNRFCYSTDAGTRRVAPRPEAPLSPTDYRRIVAEILG
jgi:hypothetical protein